MPCLPALAGGAQRRGKFKLGGLAIGPPGPSQLLGNAFEHPSGTKCVPSSAIRLDSLKTHGAGGAVLVLINQPHSGP